MKKQKKQKEEKCRRGGQKVVKEKEETNKQTNRQTHSVTMSQSGTSNVRGTSGSFPGRDL